MRITRGIVCVVALFAMVTADAIGGFTYSGGMRAYADGAPAIVPALTVRAEAPATVRFGDSFAVKITVTNNLKTAVRWAKDKVWVEPREWDTYGLSGSGLGNDVALQTDKDANAEVVIAPGAVVVCEMAEDALTQESLGRIEANFELRTDDQALHGLWTDANGRAKVVFEIQPSALMEMVWTAKTDAERAKAQTELNGWLRRVDDENGHVDRSEFEVLLGYLGSYAIPYMEQATSDKDAVVREAAVRWLTYAEWGVGQLNSRLEPSQGYVPPAWTKGLAKGDEKDAAMRCRRVAIGALADGDGPVRVAAIGVLRNEAVREDKGPDTLTSVTRLVKDPQPAVRAEAIYFLSLFAGEKDVAETIVQALSDGDVKVQQKALDALDHGPHAPPVEVLRDAFAGAHGATAIRLLAMLYEQEDAELPAALAKGFAERTDERLAILSAVAGHRDASVLELVKAGLADKRVEVQRAALLRLMAFPQETAGPMVDAYVRSARKEMATFAKAVAQEIQTRKQFGFLRDGVAAMNAEFPSHSGTVPMVSPDGKWLAYTETGSGGMSRGNMVSIAHVVKVDGTGDRAVSELFLVGWMADSKHVGTNRDGFAAISDLDGNITAEFGAGNADGSPLGYRSGSGFDVPRRKHLDLDGYFAYGEDQAFSPDGKWLGPLERNGFCEFVAADGSKMTIPLAKDQSVRGQAMWSPDGRYVACSLECGMVWNLIDTQEKTAKMVVRGWPRDYESWDYRKCRWNPWSKDGKQLASVSDGQVCVMAADGSAGRQVTFDATRKAWPTFSRDGKRVAYVTWQEDNRVNYPRVGPTDVWVVDLETGLAARVTAPEDGRVFCLDWIDDQTLIVDRVKDAGMEGYKGALEKISLDKAVGQATRPG